MPGSLRSLWDTDAVRLMALALGAFALALASIVFTRDHGQVAAIWPGNALALAVLLNAPPRKWLAYCAAAVAGLAAANASVGDGPFRALSLAACNGAEILIAAALAARLAKPHVDVTRPRELLSLACAAAAAPLAPALFATAVLADSTIGTFIRWYLADALGLVLVTPALLALASGFRSLPETFRRKRNIAPVLALVAALAVVFGQQTYPVLFLLFPPLVWCAMALGGAGVALVLLATTVVAVLSTLSGHGTASLIEGDLQAKLAILQVLLATITLVTLPLTAVLAERRRLNASLREALDKVGESEARYRTLADNITDVIVCFGPDAVFTYVSPSVRGLLGYEPEELTGKSIKTFMHPDDYRRALGLYGENAIGGNRTFQYEYRAYRKDGSLIWLSGHPKLIVDPETGQVISFQDTVRDITASKLAEQALAESENRYRILADNASDVVLKFDNNATIRYASPSVSQFGYAPEDLIGRHAFELIHAEDIGGVDARVGDMTRTGTAETERSRTYRVITKDGRRVWAEGRPTVVRDEYGNFEAVVTQIRDISDRVEAEREILASEARYRMLAEHSTDLIVKIDAQGIVTYVSPSIRRLGYEPEEIVGTSPLAMVHPDDRDAVIARMRARREIGVAGVGECYRILTKDGDYIWVESNPSTVLNEDGSVAAVISQLRDVTARVAQEAELAEGEARYRMLADHATDVILKVDAEDTILYVSPSASRYGYAPEDLLGRSGYTIVHPDDVVKLRTLIAELFRAGVVDEATDRTYRIRTADGEYVWMEGNPSLVRNEAGEVEAVISQLRDVSVRVCLEAQLLAARDEAEAAAATKAEFMANMSHEIRTPLTAVLGFTNLLSNRDDLAPESRRQVDRIGAAGQAMLAIVNDVLDFSKLEAGLMPVSLRPTAPLEVLENALALFEPQAEAKGLRLEFEAGELPPHVDIDPDRVRQVLLNLIGNAVKFTDDGVVTVRATYGERRLKVAVRDSGAGMTEAQQAKLFRRFSQVDGAAARTGGGTGLGLAISLGLVEAMGGEIGLTSAVGQGSTFSFDIPAPACEGADSAAEDSSLSGVAGLRVLLVDDNPTNRELAHALMAQFEIEVTDACDGAQAVEAAALLPYDVILLDLRMPVMDGPTAAARIRGEPGPNQSTPILAFSADHELDAAFAGLFDGHVRKPIEVLPLLEAVVQVTAWEDEAYAAEG